MNSAPGPAGGRRPASTGIRKSGSAGSAGRLTTEWVVVVPVKGTSQAKSRFGPGDHSALALAMAADTVAAAIDAVGVAGVLVVTTVEASAVFDDLGAFVIVQQPDGLASAISLGLSIATEMTEPGRGIAVLLGDLPALTPEELSAALTAARAHPLAMVEDAAGEGTALITAVYGATHAPAFGRGSSAAHRAAGYMPLEVSSESGLRNDVDSADALRPLEGRLGARTTQALRANP
ncbi:2-phospho-L-lactate guanylyltransferase [Glaciihabitans sp. INWT7]|uniref:2-phospho-L-lactate guanylyltransferase n=1 Tax=Glaciihabitans sp. INWT7 TaxID=2596912 RepID=UPI0016253221|nr:2-phospho-L-lactate guanylyltransferase [Glaciihabitans sp. INWT7]